MDITILVGTCDKYKFLWNNFGLIFDRYWDNSINIPKYFVSETIGYYDYGFDSILPGKVAYSSCLRYALDRIDTKYVLWLQDDYFLIKTINKTKFYYYMSIIQDRKIDRFGIHDDCHLYSKIHIKENIYKLHRHSLYTISMQASIWNVNFFKSCLIENGVENPWQFELRGTSRLNKRLNHNIFFDKQETSWYKQAMKKGHPTADYYFIIEKENLIGQSESPISKNS